MSSEEENKQIALSIVEALNTRTLSVWSKHLAQDYTAEHPGVSVPLNKTMSIGYNQRFVTAFPDIPAHGKLSGGVPARVIGYKIKEV